MVKHGEGIQSNGVTEYSEHGSGYPGSYGNEIEIFVHRQSKISLFLKEVIKRSVNFAEQLVSSLLRNYTR